TAYSQRNQCIAGLAEHVQLPFHDDEDRVRRVTTADQRLAGKKGDGTALPDQVVDLVIIQTGEQWDRLNPTARFESGHGCNCSPIFQLQHHDYRVLRYW